MDKKNKYWQLFLSTFKLSACTFGGGFVIIPLMRERFVKELHWIEEEEMLDLTAIAQSSPGSIAINASILVGYHVAGIPGALITVVGSHGRTDGNLLHHRRVRFLHGCGGQWRCLPVRFLLFGRVQTRNDSK